MKNKIVKAAAACMLAAIAADTALAVSNATENSEANMEKCYGIVKAGMNDCQTINSSCAGSATKNNQPDAFLFLPKGVCNKIVGGSLTAKTTS